MKSIRNSLVFKTFVFAAIIVAVEVAGWFLADSNFSEIRFSSDEVLLILLGFFAVLMVFFAWQVLIPLRKIVRELRAANAGKPYKKVTFGKKSDEMAHLADFFNQVVEAVKKVSSDLVKKERMSAELVTAKKVQKRLLPNRAPEIEGLDLLVKTKSASEVGGDNFDIIEKKKQTLVYIGDATGHGMSAGLVMSMINVLVHSFAQFSDDPREILTNVNRALTPKIPDSMFMTLAMLRWDHASQRLFYTGCGHEHILIYRAATKKCEAIKTGGIALGMFPDISKIIKEKEIKLAANDVAVLFTDGITEAKGPDDEMFGIDRLRDLVEKNGYQTSARGIFSVVSKGFAKFVGRDHLQADDITLLVAKRAEKKSQLDVDTAGIPEMKQNWEWED